MHLDLLIEINSADVTGGLQLRNVSIQFSKSFFR